MILLQVKLTLKCYIITRIYDLFTIYLLLIFKILKLKYTPAYCYTKTTDLYNVTDGQSKIRRLADTIIKNCDKQDEKNQ